MANFIRDHFGLTQERLASWLGVNRVVVAQAESGQRGIPLSSGLQEPRLALAAMGKLLNPDGTAQASDLPPLPPPAPDTAPLAYRLAECRYQVSRLSRELKGMQARAQCYTNRLAALPTLRAYVGPVKNPARETGWLALFEGEAVDGLRDDCGPGPSACSKPALPASPAKPSYWESCCPYRSRRGVRLPEQNTRHSGLRRPCSSLRCRLSS